MTGKPIDEAVLDRACEAYAEIAGDYMGFVRRRAMREALIAAQQGQSVAECHCATCTCAPGMTPAVRFDTSPAAQEGAVRDHLIALGWTPPGAQQTADEEQGGGDVNMVVTVRDGTWVGTYAEWCRRKQIPPPSAPVGVDWITGDGLQGIKAEAHFLTQHKEEAVQLAGKRLLDRADKIIAALYQPPSEPVGVEDVVMAARNAENAIRNCAAAGQIGEGYVQYADDLRDAVQRLAQQPAAVDEAMVERAAAAVMSAPPGISVEAYVRIVLEAAIATKNQEPKS